MQQLIERAIPVFEAMKLGPARFREIKEIDVNSETIGAIREKVFQMRETKGMELSTLHVLSHVRKEASKQELWKDVTELWHEQALVGKHLVMAKEMIPRSLRKITHPLELVTDFLGIWLMEQAVKKSDSILDKPLEFEGKDFLRRRQGRFRGDVLMQKGHYEQAVDQFDQSIALFDQLPASDSLLDRANILEIKGFKADGLIRLSENKDLKEGVKLGLSTYNEYETTQEGQELKEKDFARWVTWKAGSVCKMTKALLDTGELENILDGERMQIFQNLKEVYGQGRGIDNFEMREKEIEVYWDQLSLQYPEVGNLSI